MGAGGGAERTNLPRRRQETVRSAAVGDLVVPALFFVAGLLRPEAWGLGMLFLALRWWRGVQLGSLVTPALVVLAAPILWALTDLVLSGDPLYSLTGTQQLAEALGRKTGLANAPIELVKQLGDLARPPVAAAGLVGAALAVWRLGWRPLLVPLAPLVAGVLGFVLVGALGLPLLQRYLLVPAALLGVFAGIAAAAIVAAALGRPLPGALGVGRGTELGEASASSPASPSGPAAASPAASASSPAAPSGPAASSPAALSGPAAASPAALSGPAAASATSESNAASPASASAPGAAVRLLATAALAVGVLGVGGYLVLKASSFRTLADGVLREAQWQQEGTELLEQPELRAARACGPITLPTYRFVAEMQLATGLRPTEIVSRATELGGSGPQPSGIAVTIDGPKAARTRIGEAAAVPHATNTVPAGFTVVARRGPFVAATRCP